MSFAPLKWPVYQNLRPFKITLIWPCRVIRYLRVLKELQTKLDLWNLLLSTQHRSSFCLLTVAELLLPWPISVETENALFFLPRPKAEGSASSWWNMAIIVHWLHNYSRALIYGPGLSFQLKIRPKKELPYF